MLAYYSEFSVEYPNTSFNRNWLSCYHIISACQIWGFATRYFKTSSFYIFLPSLALWENHMLCIDYPRMCLIRIIDLGIEDILATEPCIVYEIVLFVAYP